MKVARLARAALVITAGALLISFVGIGLLWFALLFHHTQTRAA